MKYTLIAILTLVVSLNLSAKLVGLKNPVDLREKKVSTTLINSRDIIAKGGWATVYGSYTPGRAFKVGPERGFENGEEVWIAQIAGSLKIGPVVYNAVVDGDNIIIEMQLIKGESLSKIYKRLKEQSNTYWNKPEWKRGLFYNDVKPPPKDIKAIDIVKDQFKDPASIENFFFQLFTALKALTENGISPGDVNYGNIMIDEDKSVKLVDFGYYKHSFNIEEAKKLLKEVVRDEYSLGNLLTAYKELENLSEKSKTLIESIEQAK
jgi:serine/threonine protein kinase